VLNPCSPLPDQVYSSMFTKQDLMPVQNKENYILQKKVAYAPANKDSNGTGQCGIRMFDDHGEKRRMKKAKVVNNLVRISKGENGRGTL